MIAEYSSIAKLFGASKSTNWAVAVVASTPHVQ